jgi:hypothetical protein
MIFGYVALDDDDQPKTGIEEWDSVERALVTLENYRQLSVVALVSFGPDGPIIECTQTDWDIPQVPHDG